MNDDENKKNYVIVYIDEPSNVIWDYNYYDYNEIINYQINNLYFDSKEKFKLFYFKNEKEGDIYIKFDNKIKKESLIYIYEDKKFIHKIEKGFNGNYLIKEDISDLNQYYFSKKNIDLFIIIYNENGFEKNNFILFSSKMFYTIESNKNSNIEFYSIKRENQDFNYKINKLNIEKYLHIQWNIYNEYAKAQIIIYNDNIDEPYFTNKGNNQQSNYIKLNHSIDYNIKLNITNNNTDNIYKININFDFTDFSDVIIYNEKEFSIPILSKQILYLIQPISFYQLNEKIGYKIQKVNYNIKLSIKYFKNEKEENLRNNVNKIKEYNYIFDKGDCNENNCLYSTNKIEESNYLLLKIEFIPEYISYNIFKIEKIPFSLIINSSINLMLEKYEMKELSFHQISNEQSIIIYSNNSNAVTVNNYPNINSKKKLLFYIVDNEIINKDVSFLINDNTINNSYQVNITYSKNNQIIYHQFNKSRNELLSYRIQIDDCSKEYYYFNYLNELNYVPIIYFDILYGESEIYFKDFNEISSSEDLFNFNNNESLYTYPKPFVSEYDISQIFCKKPSLINVFYLNNNINYNDEEIILKYGDEYNIYFKTNEKKIIQINNNSEIYSNEFFIEFKLISSLDKQMTITFNGENKYLNKDDTITRFHLKNITNTTIELESLKDDALLIIQIGLNKTLYDLFSDFEKLDFTPNKNYSIFLYPKNNEINSTNFSKIIIKNTQLEETKFCLKEGFDGINYINSPINANCYILKNNEQKIFKTSYPYKEKNKIEIRQLNNDDNNEFFYSIFYFEEPEKININYSFDINDTGNKSLTLIIVIIILFVVLIIVGIIYYLINKYKSLQPVEKYEEEINNNLTTSLELEKGINSYEKDDSSINDVSDNSYVGRKNKAKKRIIKDDE